MTNSQLAAGGGSGQAAPNTSGLIRLTLRKPMGIVFEPMYDPNAPSVQRGVRICDLPRTGAAALSRKLEVGDELLSINDKTMSRLTFDEIMDFIIEADPEEVNLLFRRPKKETLKERAGIKTPSNNNTTSSQGVKWVDDDSRKKKETKKKEVKGKDKEKKPPRKSKNRDDDETLQSEEPDYRKGRKKGKKKHPYESESFLDILIDTICANPDSVCRDRRRGEDEDYSDDDETFGSRDDSTYVTYESEDHRKATTTKTKAKAKGQNRDDDSSTYGETEEDTLDEKDKRKPRDKDSSRLSPPKEAKRPPTPDQTKKYEDDNTLETLDSAERAKHIVVEKETPIIPPLGLAPNPEPIPIVNNVPEETDDEGNPAPIKEVEYDDQVDHGADVSVMESLGGPSLLIEKQRAAQMTAQKPTVPTPPVPPEIMDNFGKDYPLDFGFSREQTIQNDPLRFYTFVVRSLLQEHEPEKVRLLDKLLAKYRGREDHLVQKLSVRYNKEEEEEEEAQNFEEAVRKEKDSAHVRTNVETARERVHNDFNPTEWPEKETKEGDPGDEEHPEEESESEYSGDSIDGTSPAVIAQVSELLNYVYGKTSVPGQIDRVSTIMRAYEGREAVLLELLETKALIKANREKENAGNLPSFLRNSANAQRTMEIEVGHSDMPPVTPMAVQPPITDDISSMSGVSTPAAESRQVSAGVLKQISGHYDGMPNPVGMEKGIDTHYIPPPSSSVRPPPTPDRAEAKKKKKGLFGGLFGKKGKKSKDDRSTTERTNSRTRGLRSPMVRKGKNSDTSI